LGGDVLYARPPAGLDHDGRWSAHRFGHGAAGRCGSGDHHRRHPLLFQILVPSGKFFDDLWQNLVGQQLVQQWTAMGIDAEKIAETRAILLSSEGRAGWLLATVSLLMMFLLLFAVLGGVIGARVSARAHRSRL
jgi:hypothetical protein